MNKELKPVEEWYKMLPEPYRSQALEAKRNNPPTALHKATHARSICDALINGFDWEDAGGFNKWHAIYCKIQRGEIEISTRSINTRIPRKYKP